MIVRQAAVVCPQHHYSIGNWRGQNLLQLASIYRPTKYPLPVSVTNSALPCLAAPSFVYPLLPPITIHHSYRTTYWRPAKTPQPKIRPATCPQQSLVHPRPLRSTIREFLSQRHPASSPSSVPKAEGQADRMLNIISEIRTPNTSFPESERRTHRISDVREPVTGRL